MWTCREYCHYLEAFVKHYCLQPHVQFGTRVIFVRRSSSHASKWEVGIQKMNDSNLTMQTFDAIAVCSGLHQRPNIPSWCQELRKTRNDTHKMHRQLQVVHSSQVVYGSDYKDKRVVIIGLGESGSDLSLLIAPHAASLTLSVRVANGSGHVLPRYTENEVADLNTSRGYPGETWSQADHGILAKLVENAILSGNDKALHNLARCYIGTDSFTDLDLMAIEWNARYHKLTDSGKLLKRNGSGRSCLSFPLCFGIFLASFHFVISTNPSFVEPRTARSWP